MLPEINSINTRDNIIGQFYGLNHKSSCSDKEFTDMKNMTSDEFPYLASRKGYATRMIEGIEHGGHCYGMCVYGKDVYSVQEEILVSGNHYYLCKNFNEKIIELDESSEDRQLVVYGAYICIFPDNIMYNAEDSSITYINLEKNYSNASIYLSDINGIPYIANEYTPVQASPESSLSFKGFSKNIATFGPSSNTEIDDALKRTDNKLKSILNNYIQYFIPSFIENTFTVYYDDNSSNTLPNFNIIISNHDNLYVLSDDSSYNLFAITKAKNGDLSLQSYNSSMNMFSPVDIYLTIWLQTNDAEYLESNIKAGDYIEIDCLKANGNIYEESETKKTWFKLINKLKNRVRVEKILRKNNEIGIIIKGDDVDYLNIIKDGNGRINYRRVENYRKSADEEMKYATGLNYFNGVMSLSGTGGNSICQSIKIIKKAPEMDYITVCANRIWGCSSENHEIYACKQGDATSWYNYGGLSSDSYAVTIPSGDKFTGAITFNDYPYFFTEKKAYSIYGNKPKNYQVQEYKCRGVASGAYRTIAEKDGYLYYKSTEGIEQFNGTNSRTLTENLDISDLSGEYGAICGDKYYVFLRRYGPSGSGLYIYDISKKMWHKEEYYQYQYLLNLSNNLYSVNFGYPGKITLKKIAGKSSEASEALESTPTYDIPKWFVISGEFNAGLVSKKYITKFVFEMKLEEGAQASILLSYDDSDEWERVFKTTEKQVKKIISIPIIPKRCERMKYKIEGKGQVKIYSILRSVEVGSEASYGND